MKNAVAVSCLSITILVVLASVACGSGNSNVSTLPPTTTVVATTHPLVAQYSVQYSSGMSAWVEFGPDTSYGRQTSVDSTPVSVPASGQWLTILVAGMKPQTTYHMRMHTDGPGGSWVDQDHTFTTQAIPTTQPAPQIAIAPPPTGAFTGFTPAPGVELLSFVSQTGKTILDAVVTDLQGNVIWYCPNTALPMKPMANGDYIIVDGTDLVEVDLTCATIRDFSTADANQSLQTNGYDFTITGGFPLGGFHHDVLVLPNGHWIAIAQVTRQVTGLTGYSGATTVTGDAVLDIDPTGNVVWAWNSFDHLDLNRHLQGLPDWTHSNAIISTADGNLLLSMRNQSWVLKLDYENGTGTGDVLWRLGDGGDFTISGGDPSQWFYGQHYPHIEADEGSETTLSVFDDGNLRTYSDGATCGTTALPCYSRATLFQIDESTMSAALLWEDSPGYYTFWGGSIGLLSNGDMEFDISEPYDNVASASLIREVTPPYWATPQTVWQMNITGANAYRGYRIPSLYPGVTWQQ